VRENDLSPEREKDGHRLSRARWHGHFAVDDVLHPRVYTAPVSEVFDGDSRLIDDGSDGCLSTEKIWRRAIPVGATATKANHRRQGGTADCGWLAADSTAKSVQELPCRFVGDAQTFAEEGGGHATVLGDQGCRNKPMSDGNVAPMQECSGCDRVMSPASPTDEDSGAGSDPAVSWFAARALEPTFPAERSQAIGA